MKKKKPWSQWTKKQKEGYRRFKAECNKKSVLPGIAPDIVCQCLCCKRVVCIPRKEFWGSEKVSCVECGGPFLFVES